MDFELRNGGDRFTIKWSPNRKTLAVIANPEAPSAIIDRALNRAAPQGAVVKPAQLACLSDAPDSPAGIVGRLRFDGPQSDEVRLTLENTVCTALITELNKGT
jgi:hypothetical protein